MTADPRRARRVAEAPSPSACSPFAEDRDRVLGSAAFQRLRDVTQVMAPGTPGRFHNRLTHSLEVARIGRQMAIALLEQPGSSRVAETAGGLDPDVVEAACLAHDLGHPPFGHDAEDELNHLLTRAGVADGFEANAQAFRVAARLAERESEAPGLNLTRATMAAIVKYPWQRHASAAIPHKWGVYASEADELAWARAILPTGSQEPTLEAAIMDWADLVAYAAHDFEDFARAGLIPMDLLLAGDAERNRFLALVAARRGIAASERSVLSRICDRLLATCPRVDMGAGQQAISDFTARRIAGFVRAISLSETGPGAASLVIDRERVLEVYLLEGLTWHYVIDSDLLLHQRTGQRQIIQGLFDTLAEAASREGSWHRFPPLYQRMLQEADNEPARLRIVADFIASLREDEAMERSGGFCM